mmetsp:Transcript_2582/g.9136  ORF Transcript_2582/g.9136 Transcript_2582/m.9136 type:complete len:227 (-) Transcript_2582:336-1016(-)
MITLYFSREGASFRYVRSSITRWCGDMRLSTILLESICTSTSRRERLSSDRRSLMACMIPLHTMPYMRKPSSLMCTPKFSTCTMPSSSSKCTSASKFTNVVSSKSRMSTSVRPSLWPMNSVASGSMSTTAVKNPPATRSDDPSRSFSATTWFTPMGIHSPMRRWRSLHVRFSSSSSLMLDAAFLSASMRFSLDAFSLPSPGRTVSGMYGLETYDTDSISVMELSRS